MRAQQHRFRSFGFSEPYAFVTKTRPAPGVIMLVFPDGKRRAAYASQFVRGDGVQYYMDGDVKTLLVPEGVSVEAFLAGAAARGIKIPGSTVPVVAVAPAPVKTAPPRVRAAETPVVVTMKPPPPDPVVVDNTTYVAVSNSAPRVVPAIIPDLVDANAPALVKDTSRPVPAPQATVTAPPVAQAAAAPAAAQATVPASKQIVDVPSSPAPTQEAGVAAPALPSLSLKWLVLGVAGLAAWAYFGPGLTKAFSASPGRRSYGREIDG